MKTILESAFDTPLVSFTIANRTGTSAEAIGSEGLICHSAELGMRGTATLSRADFDEKIDTLGASMGFSFRRDSLSLSGMCLRRHLEELVDLAHQVLSSPALPESEHEKLQRETLAELDEMRDSDASLASRFFNRHFHPGHIYCRTAVGTEESLRGLQLQSVRDLYPSLFPYEDLVLGIAGPVSPEEATQLHSRFRPDNSTRQPEPDLSSPKSPAGRRLIFVNKPGRLQCQVAIGHLMPAYGSDRFDALRVAEAAFGGMFSSRLMQEIRVKQAWSYGASCNIYRARGEHALCISMAPAAEVCPDAIAKALSMYEDLQRVGLEEDEFEFTRSYLVGHAPFGYATATQRLYQQVEEEIYELPKGYGQGFAERISTIDCKTVNSAISDNATPNSLCVVVVGTADKTLAQLEKLGFDSVDVVDYRSY